MPNKNTLFVGKVFIDLPRVDSTNEYAIGLLTKSTPSEGTVISTFEQTAGRGQIGSHWESQAGQNISLSVILFPRFLRPAEQFYLTQVISLALCDVLQPLLKGDVQIKWPNDIYVNDRKITGILIQSTLNSSGIQSSVIGIGINVNQVQFSSDLPNPTSLKLETGQNFDLYQIIEELCAKLEGRYLQLKSRRFSVIHQSYLELLYGWKKERSFRKPGGLPFKGHILGTDVSGRLQIKSSSGSIETFSLKEIQFLF